MRTSIIKDNEDLTKIEREENFSQMALKKEENNERQGSIFDENKDNNLMTKRPKTGVADNKLAHVRKVLETIYNFNGVKSHKI
jgi:hypothetical protein